jgi:hypothetical protein
MREPAPKHWDFIPPICPICGDKISGIIGSERLWCFECKVFWDLDLEVASD